MNQISIKKIQVTNFRNLTNQIITFSDGINCIFGNNGNGKTNLLEAIYYLLNKKSFRKNTTFQQIINVECEKPEILFSSIFSDNSNQMSYTGKVSININEWYYNNEITKKKINLNALFINPFDSFNFHTTPSFRRVWFDQHFSILSKEYKTTLSKFNQALRFRNNLLSKKPGGYKEQILAIDEQFTKYSYELIKFRKEFLSELKEYCMYTFKLIFDEVHNLEIELEAKFSGMSQKEIHQFYLNSLENDILLGHTRNGVHRDDYIFNFDGFNSYEFCSLGQQKMSFLSLLFAYIELFRYKFKTYPMVLIDDVSGELDERRWKNLISYLQAKKFQVLITTANENFKKELEKIEDATKIFITNGSIRD